MDKKLIKVQYYNIRNYNKNSDKGFIFEVGVEYPKHLYNLSSGFLPFLTKFMKINKSPMPICNLYDKEKYLLDITSLKQASNYKFKY